MGEFCKSAPAHHLRNPNDGVYLVWKWGWSNSCDSLPSPYVSDSECDQQSTESDVCASELEVYDTVRVKVIGVSESLEKANELIRAKNDVKVALFHEPDNPVDSRAVSFMCLIDGKWHNIGYVVKEALDDVHVALSSNAISDVKIAWLKFRIDFYRSGPAFYAAVYITRKGHWSSVVHCSASTK